MTRASLQLSPAAQIPCSTKFHLFTQRVISASKHRFDSAPLVLVPQTISFRAFNSKPDGSSSPTMTARLTKTQSHQMARAMMPPTQASMHPRHMLVQLLLANVPIYVILPALDVQLFTLMKMSPNVNFSTPSQPTLQRRATVLEFATQNALPSSSAFPTVHSDTVLTKITPIMDCARTIPREYLCKICPRCNSSQNSIQTTQRHVRLPALPKIVYRLTTVHLKM